MSETGRITTSSVQSMGALSLVMARVYGPASARPGRGLTGGPSRGSITTLFHKEIVIDGAGIDRGPAELGLRRACRPDPPGDPCAARRGERRSHGRRPR